MLDILRTLQAIPVSKTTYDEWLRIGIALKHEGYDCATWDSWSKDDKRYHPGECERKWASFRESENPVTAATIVQIAKDYGYNPHPFEGDGVMDWNDTIFYDGDDFETVTAPDEWNPTEQLIHYLETLFDKDDYVGYVTGDVWQDRDGRWVPAKGIFHRTAAELIASLKKHPDDLGATVGDWKPEVGAWIRFNPVDGDGVKNENVTSFRYALVESDTMSVSEQDAMYRKLELPIVFLVHSGGKSLHAIVRIDAADYTEYRKRVEFLYDFLEKNGVLVDKQNRNPSRLSRMPGITRNGNRQYIVAENIGRKSWMEWMDYVEGASDELPAPVALSEVMECLPQPPEALIDGVLRKGHKMLISGPSKAGKSFALMELSVAFSEGLKWLKFKCKKGKVMYVNFEIDTASCFQRFMEIYKARNIKPRNAGNLVIWNLRGKAAPLDKLVPKLIRRLRQDNYMAVVIDPIYKVLTGDENTASEMAHFCNQFDRICDETGCSVIYCHHHSKGSQGQKSMLDRSSGSGVFARDPDAVLDITELDVPENTIWRYAPKSGDTPWHVEGSLREFAPFKPFNCWFSYPLHPIDEEGVLDGYGIKGSVEANFSKRENFSTPRERKDDFETAFDVLRLDKDTVSIQEMATYLGLSERTVRNRLKEFSGDFVNERGTIRRNQK